MGVGGGGGRHGRGGGAEGLGERGEREERDERDERDERGADGDVGGERYIGSLLALRRRKVNGILHLSGWNLVGILLLLILRLPTTVQAVELDQQDKVFGRIAPPSSTNTNKNTYNNNTNTNTNTVPMVDNFGEIDVFSK